MATRSVMDTPNYPVKSASLDASSLGSNQVVAASSGKSINVLSMALVTTLANSVKFLSAASQISPTMPLASNGGFVLPYNPYGWFKTEAGEALNVNLSVGTAIGVIVTYIEE